ncbi:MAG: DUF1501 domain-containing protein [Planctomycetaceae bacterium]
MPLPARDPLQHSQTASRRHVLKLGSLGLFGTAALPQFMQLAAHAATGGGKPRPVEAVILFEHYGAPSQIDTWDPKPKAPDNIRGEFQAIETSLPGYYVTDIMPRVAKLCDRFCMIHSMSHKIFNHNPGTYQAITGSDEIRDIVQVANGPGDWPAYGSVMAKYRGPKGNVPPFVSLPHVAFDQVYKCPGQWGALLGNEYDPFFVTQNPNAAAFRVSDFDMPNGLDPNRLADRRRLLAQIDRATRRLDEIALRTDIDTNYARAFDLLTSPVLKRAFDLSAEPDSLRDRYGRNQLGQSLLLSRRLVESGVRFVTCFSGSNPGDPLGWDTHGDNFRRLKDRLMPPDDQGFSALIEDLEGRGLLDSTLVIWAGEFGRKPQIAVPGPTFVSAGGRDHWPSCYTIVLAGGGVKAGFRYGSSDVFAAYPGSEPTRPQDIAATLYWAMGIDPHETRIADQFGRPRSLSEGRVLRELFI